MELSTNDLLADLNRWTKMYLYEKKTLSRAKNTLEQYTKVLDDFYEYAADIADMFNIQDLNKQHILGYLMYKDGSTKSFCENSKKTHVTIIKAFFKYITENNDEGKDLVKSLKSINISTPKREPDGLTAEELERILKSFRKNISLETTFTQTIILRNRLIFKILVFGGLRASELLSLELENFVLDTENKVYKVSVIGKGNKERFIYIPTETISTELEYLRKIGYTYVAQTSKGKKIDRKNLYTIVLNILKQNNIKKKGVHLLRHTFARNLVSNNISISTIKTLMGHSNLETTMIYAKTNEANMINAIQSLNKKDNG